MDKKATKTKNAEPAAEPVATAQNKPNMMKLQALVNATNSAAGYLLVPPTDPDLKLLTDLKLADTNEAIKDENGNIAAKATPEGVKYADLMGDEETQGETPAPQIANTKPIVEEVKTVTNALYSIDDDVAYVPGKRGGAGRAPVLPLDDLKVGQSLHVAVSEKYPDPVKNLASTVSGINARYAEETDEMETVTVSTYQLDANGKRVKENGHYVKTGEEEVTRPKVRLTRKYAIQAARADDKKGPGARIFRLR